MSDKDVLTDHSRLSWADQSLHRLERFLALVSGYVIFALILLSVVNVLGRWLFAYPVSGYIDWVEQMMPFLAFIGMAFVQRSGGHIRMDIFIGRLQQRVLYIFEFVFITLTLFIAAVLCYGTYLHFLRAFSIGDSSLDIHLPVWPAKLIVPIAFAFLLVRLFIQLWGYANAIKTNGIKTIAVPVLADAKKLAEDEARVID